MTIANRLASAVKTGLRGDYVHNAGERVKKTTTTGSGGPVWGCPERFHAYDEVGQSCRRC